MKILGESTSFSSQICRSMQYVVNQQIMVTQFLTTHQNCKLKLFQSDLLINRIWQCVIYVEFPNLQHLSITINLLIFKNMEYIKDIVNQRIKVLLSYIAVAHLQINPLSNDMGNDLRCRRRDI